MPVAPARPAIIEKLRVTTAGVANTDKLGFLQTRAAELENIKIFIDKH